MPVHRGRDSRGPYYQWGEHGTKYYYEAGSGASRQRAKKHAIAQGAAVERNERGMRFIHYDP